MLQIHQKIEQARLSANLTQDEMAEKLGIKRSTYQYWEKKTPGIDKIKQVQKVLGLPDDYFFGRNDEKVETKNPDPMSQDYREKFYQLLEKNSKLEEKIEANSKTMEGNMIHLTDLILQGQDDMVQKIGREFLQRLDALEKSLVSSLKAVPGKKPVQKGKH